MIFLILAISHLLPSTPPYFIFLTMLLFICDYLIIFAMLKMTMHCDHTIFRRFSHP